MKGSAIVVLSLALCSELAAGVGCGALAHRCTTRLEFVATEGTWMSVDVSPDGAHIVFDLLGHLYEMPFAGGKARPLTQGRSWNMFPRYSPDGRSIAFTSDRGGVDNIWVIDRASGHLTSVSSAEAPVFRASWSADGRVLYAAAIVDGTLESKALQLGLHGTVQELVRGGQLAPLNQFSEDPRRGRILFEHNDQHLYQSGARIKAYDKRNGQTTLFIERPGGAFNPVVSPNGRLLAYLNRDDQKTRLIIRDLETHLERELTDALDRDRQEYKGYHHGAYPNMAWHPNSRELVLSFGGGIHVVDVATGAVRTVPFRAPVSRQVDRALRFPTPVPQGESRSRTHRWAKRTEHGILYETLGDLYLKNGREARNLTASSAHETSTVYDSRTGTLYYASWSDDELGAVFSRKLSGGSPVRLTSRPVQYGALALTPDGSTLVFLRGSARIENGLQRLDEEREFEIVAVGADRRERRITDLRWAAQFISKAHQPPTLTVDSSGNVYFTEFSGDTLLLRRIPLQGGEKTTLYRFPHAVYATVSPDVRWVAFQEYHRSYVLPFEYVGRPVLASGADRQGGPRRVDARDGYFLTWRDAQTLQWTRGKEFLEKSLSEVLNGRSSAARSTDISVPFRVATPASTIALRGVRVITMRTPDEVLDDATVLVEGNRVRAVGQDVTIPAGSRVFDLRGHTVMPGIIDVHAHPGGGLGTLNIIEQRPFGHAAALAHGVTTMYEVAGRTLKDFWLSDMILKGDIAGPRFFSVGNLMYGRHTFRGKQFRSIQSLEDAREHAAFNKDHGATALKDYANYSRAVRHQIVTAAKELGLNVVAESGGLAQSNFTRLVDGVTGLEHGMGITPMYDDVVRLFAATGAGVTPTLVVLLDGPRGELFFHTTERLWENEKALRFSSKDRLLGYRRAVHAWADDRYLTQMGESLKKLFAAGLPVNLGAHGQMLGLDAHWEMELFTQAGFTPLQTIQIATLNPARYHGLERELGSIEAGKLADLIVLRADPLENIRNTREIHMVMKNGVLYSGSDLSRVFPDPQPAGPMYFHR